MTSAQTTLADVTAILAELLKLNVALLSGADPSTDPTTVTCLPPEKADEASGTHLNIYLYLAAHDADGGPSLPMGSAARNPIQTVPLPLKLYYVLTAHGAEQHDGDDVLGQQELMGFAMKTLHDHPILTDGYLIEGLPVLTGDRSLNKGRIEIGLRPITPEESVSFWSTDQMRTARLAAYYEVRTVLIEPEVPTTTDSPVADVSLGVFAGGPPQLFSSSSVQSFNQAAAIGGASVSLERAPAVAMLRAVPAADAIVNATGMALGDGSDAALILRSDTLPGGEAIIDLGANPTWNIAISDQSLTFAVQPTVQPRSGPALSLLPGLYTVALLRTRELTTEDRSVATNVEVESNRLPFAIAPTIATASVTGSGNVQVVTEGGYLVESADAGAELSVASASYDQLDDTGFATPTLAGTFAETLANHYQAVPVGALTTGTYPVRLTVNGAESQPFWIEVA